MADQITVSTLGSGGVNLVKSPLEMADNEVIVAQNAEPYNDRGRFGLRKRPGLLRVVPTGTVSPSSAGGAILGGFVIDDPLGYPPPAAGDQTLFLDGYYSVDGGVTWVAYTPSQTFPALNAIYNLASTYDAVLSPQFPPVWFDGVYLAGGHESGQVLALFQARAVTGFTPTSNLQLVVQEVTRVNATGSTDDTYVLPGVYSDGKAVIAISGGGMYLYDPLFGGVTKLPTLSATATGSATWGSRLWVTAGLSLYSINPGTDSAWTTAATVSDTGIAALTGLANFNGALYAGSRTTTGSPTIRVYAFTPSEVDGSATAATSASVIQGGSPSSMFGPFPPLPGDTRLNVVYQGTAPAFTTLHGSALNAEDMAGTSWRILTFDGLWHNGVDTGSDNLINVFWGSSSTRKPGPIISIAGRKQVQFAWFLDPTSAIGAATRNPNTGATWAANALAPSLIPTSALAVPLLTF